MIETLTALVFAHVLADFALQTDWIAENKKRAAVLALHTGIVFITLVVVTGSTALIPLIILSAAHLIIDAVKGVLTKAASLRAFLIDQAAHLLSVIAIAIFFPMLWSGGLWAGYDWLLPIMATLTGLILTTMAGGYAVGMLMAPLAAPTLPDGLKRGGTVIGLLERGLVFLLVFFGHAGAIGFLIAAKSVLRFNATSNEQSASEYVIIGTLASFGWALAVSFATLIWLTHLPDLGINGRAP
ncbi:MAG: DUF3307 domain-containing protein [Pseudomonadota bacterium]